MLDRISGADAFLAALRFRTAKTRTSAAEAADEQSPATQALQQSREALNTLKQANAGQKQQRKASAKAKVERLKKELENLRLMGGDPKAIARRAAQISRELASAAKEYAASKGQAGLGLAEPGEIAAVVGAQEGGAAPDAPDAPVRSDLPAASEQAVDQGAVTEQFRHEAASIQQKGAEREEDGKFAAEVRRLHALAKSILAEQRRRAEREDLDDAGLDQIEREAAAAGAEIEHTLGDISVATVAVPLVVRV